MEYIESLADFELVEGIDGKMAGIICNMKQIESRLILGDCTKEIITIKDNTVDLVFTSPPYADSRAHTYGGVSPDKYVDWFLPISKELLRVLKPDGTFVLNIKEKAVNGERHTYVIDLILAMREQGWLWTEEFIRKQLHQLNESL